MNIKPIDKTIRKIYIVESSHAKEAALASSPPGVVIGLKGRTSGIVHLDLESNSVFGPLKKSFDLPMEEITSIVLDTLYSSFANYVYTGNIFLHGEKEAIDAVKSAIEEDGFSISEEGESPNGESHALDVKVMTIFINVNVNTAKELQPWDRVRFHLEDDGDNQIVFMKESNDILCRYGSLPKLNDHDRRHLLTFSTQMAYMSFGVENGNIMQNIAIRVPHSIYRIIENAKK